MKLSKRANRIEPSLTRKLYDMAKSYDDVVDFTLGDPDYETPDRIKEAGCRAIREGRTKYSENAGVLELRKVIAGAIAEETGIQYDPAKEIQITVGAMEALFLTLACMIDPGDEVIIPSPYWVNYKHMVDFLGGKAVLVDVLEENDFVLTPEDFRNAITDKTVAVIINSPNNPTGAVYGREALEGISDIVKKNNLTIIWDECYKSLLYDGAQYVSILDFPDMKDYSIVINSCSKKFSMTGWRLGYLAGPAAFVENLPKIQENVAACAGVPSQYAAIEAFKGENDTPNLMRDGFEKRRNTLIAEIRKIDKLSVKSPKGTFYALVNIKETGLKSEEFAYKLLESQKVAVVPGITYGDACEGYIRIAFTMNEEKIIEGVRRIRQFVESL